MQFCNDCGAVLNLLEFPDEELCYSCRKSKNALSAPSRQSTQTSARTTTAFNDSLAKATLSHENNLFVLKSPEGWTLWSSPDTATVTMDKIVAQAERILTIRTKREKK